MARGMELVSSARRGRSKQFTAEKGSLLLVFPLLIRILNSDNADKIVIKC